MGQTKKTRLKKIFTISHLNLFMLVLLLGFTAYTLFAPIVPAKYDKPVITSTGDVVAGKTLTYNIKSCRYVSEGVVTTITRKLVSTTDKSLVPISLSADTITNHARCLDSTRTVVVPYSTPPGNYQLVITGVYQVIPLRAPITVTATTDSFNLVEGDPNSVIISNELETAPLVPTVRGSSSTTPKQSSGSSSTTNNQTTTNNSVTNNTTTTPAPAPTPAPTPLPTQPVPGTESAREPGAIQTIVNGLTGGLDKLISGL